MGFSILFLLELINAGIITSFKVTRSRIYITIKK